MCVDNGSKVHVVHTASSDTGKLFINAVDELCKSENETKCIAFDCEGINLSRIGSVEIISFCFQSGEIFLVDIGKYPDKDIIKALKTVFDDANVTKIIHDCTMDSDALYHLHGVKLANVHDTSCFHHIITGQENINLNGLLTHYGIGRNTIRDKGIYDKNEMFWAQRPLTQQMIDWASADVDKLFVVAEKQLHHISDMDLHRGKLESEEYNNFARNCQVESNLKVTGNVGKFIGKQGYNLRQLQKATGTLIYGERQKGTWFVYYNDKFSLAMVKMAMQ